MAICIYQPLKIKFLKYVIYYSIRRRISIIKCFSTVYEISIPYKQVPVAWSAPVQDLRKNSPRTLRHSETKQSVHVDVAVVGAEKLRLLLQIVQDPIQKTVSRIHHEARGPEPTEGDKLRPDHCAVKLLSDGVRWSAVVISQIASSRDQHLVLSIYEYSRHIEIIHFKRKRFIRDNLSNDTRIKMCSLFSVLNLILYQTL